MVTNKLRVNFPEKLSSFFIRNFCVTKCLFQLIHKASSFKRETVALFFNEGQTRQYQ